MQVALLYHGLNTFMFNFKLLADFQDVVDSVCQADSCSLVYYDFIIY